MFNFLFKNKLFNKQQFSNHYLSNKNIALTHIFDSFKRYKGLFPNDVNRFDMLRWENTLPNFADFIFSYGNQVFAVIVVNANIRNNQIAMELDEREDIFVSICKENNLIPCAFPIIFKDDKPLFLGANYHNVAWNLIDVLSGKFIDPADEVTNELIEKSDWEIQDWAISITLQELENKGFKILSFISMPGIQPQIWFKDNSGKPCWVTVLGTKCSDRINISLDGYSKELFDYNGYFSQIDFAGDENHTDGRIYRGRPADFIIKDFRKIY